MKISFKRVACALMFIILLFTAGCDSGDKTDSKEIYIPILGSIQEQTIDPEFIRGAELAAEEFNTQYSDASYKLKLDWIEDFRSYEDGVAAANFLAEQENVVAVINMQDYIVAETSTDNLSKADKISVLPLGGFGRIMRRGYDNVFMTYPSFYDVGSTMAGHILDSGYERIAVYMNGTDAEREVVEGFSDTLINESPRIIDLVEYFTTRSEFNKIYERWDALEIDCIVISAYEYEKALELIRFLNERGSEIPVVGDTVVTEIDEKELADIKAKLAYPIIMDIEEDDAAYKVFATRYKSKYGEMPNEYSLYGYNTIGFVSHNIRIANSMNPEVVSDFMMDGSGYEGVGFRIQIAENGLLLINENTITIERFN